jgi:hypothetical protein
MRSAKQNLASGRKATHGPMSYGLGFCLAEPQHEIKLEIGKWRLRHVLNIRSPYWRLVTLFTMYSPDLPEYFSM